MPSAAYFYKIGFLTCCADRGLDAAQAEVLADRVLAEKAAGLTAGLAAPLALPALGLGLAGAAGVGLGYGVGSATNPDATVPTADRRIDQLHRLTAEARRRKQQLTQNPTLYS